ncbi:endonuclease domain-containing protein [Streptomyces sp. NPDC057245]|uniref:endonuclease domain-containing protein n=1 Tax=Streptomyces sp. NPDC057245 TaxID=3346065 RepID=UPI00362DF8B2
MPTLDDLPPYRRAKLLWRWAHQGPAHVEQMVIDAVGEPCRLPHPPPGPPGTTLAVPGSDGRHHLARAGQLLCGDAPTADGWTHQQHCSWHEGPDGPREWMGGRDDGDTLWVELMATWTVSPTGPGIDPGLLAKRERCTAGRYGLLHCWPPPPARTASVRRMRAALVAALGPDCHLCGLYPGAMVDHDHETGQVRGLLCGLCNRVLEECPHVTGCPRADYQNAPPAAGLGLIYPLSDEWRTRDSTRRRKVELLGFDPFEGLPTRRVSG